MGGGGGGNNTTTVQKSDPWEGQQPYLKDTYLQAQNNYNRGPITSSQQNPNAPLSAQTTQGMTALTNPNWATYLTPQVGRYGMGVAMDGGAGTKYADFASSSGGGGGSFEPGRAYQEFTKAGVKLADKNTNNYSVPTANVDAATRLKGILSGSNDPAFQAYMQSTNQQAADQVMRNKLMPQTVDQLISGGYGGSSTQNINRGAATDITNAIGQNSNKLLLDYTNQQLDAANIVTGAQRDASNTDTANFQAGVQAAGVQQNAAAAAANASVGQAANANNARELSLKSMMAGDELGLKQAALGGQLAPLYDSLQYGNANRALQVGQGIVDPRAQNEVNTNISREMFDKNAPNAALSNYSALIQGNPGATQTTSGGGGGGTSPLAGAFGGALSAGGMIGATGGTAAGGWAAPANGAAGMGAVGWAALGAGALLGSGILN